MKTSVARILILWFALAHLAIAQTRSSGPKSSGAQSSDTYKLLAVKVAGTEKYTDKDILAASGLQLGQSVAEADFKEAAQRLGDSGMFKDVVYSFSYSDAGARLEFQVTDADTKLVPARFDNFVWFTDPELLAWVQQRVPLFKQILPLGGKLADEVNAALQALLNDRHLPGRVAFLRESTPDGSALIAVVYHVEDVGIRVHNVEFPGASTEQTGFLTNGVHRAIGAEYSRYSLAAIAKFDLLPLFLQRGYLKAEFSQSDARVVTQPSVGASEPAPADEIEVDAILPVVPGKQYRVSAASWKGNSVIPTDEAAPLLHLAVGEPADAVGLTHDIQTLIKLYHSRGYMVVKVEPEAQFDDEHSTVHYDINISEGDLYRMGELEILGVDSNTKDRIRAAWTLREAQPYNADYATKFVHDAVRLFPRDARFTVTVDLTLDAKDKVVDVTIHFKMQ